MTRHQLAPRSAPRAPPPQPAAPTEGSPQPAAPVAEPSRPATTPRPVAHPPSRPVTRSLTRHQLAPRSEPRSPATPARTQANQPLRRSARIKARVCAVESRPQPAAPQLLRYEQCIGFKEGPTPSAALSWRIFTLGTKNTWATPSSSSLLCPGPWTPVRA